MHASYVGISLDNLKAARRRLEVHGAMVDDAEDCSKPVELERLMFADFAELAAAYETPVRNAGLG